MKTTRREVLRKAAYVAPVMLSLPAAPSFAQTGSGGTSGGGEEIDCDGQSVFCFYEDPEGGFNFAELEQPDPNALFCGCDS